MGTWCEFYFSFATRLTVAAALGLKGLKGELVTSTINFITLVFFVYCLKESVQIHI